jgi:hypothetical protein
MLENGNIKKEVLLKLRKELKLLLDRKFRIY